MVHVCRKASVQILLDMENVFLLLILQPLRKSPLLLGSVSRTGSPLSPRPPVLSKLRTPSLPLCFFSPFSFISANDQDKDKGGKKAVAALLPSFRQPLLTSTLNECRQIYGACH